MATLYDRNNFGVGEVVTDYNNHNCIDCNECCSMLANITVEEKNIILTEIYNNVELREYVKNKIELYKEQMFVKRELNWICLFSDDDKKCKIYDIRPSICRKFHCSNTDKIDKSIYLENFIMLINILVELTLRYFGDNDDYMVLLSEYQSSFKLYVKNLNESINKNNRSELNG